ncbi:smalltalk protein [uncultured Bacteroides sp.]|nr:smalltalk protein [uncultured Bacteroides sp.]
MKITKNTWKTILKVIGTIIATIAGALGISGMTPQ